MPKPILYSLDFSPPVRSVKLVAAAIGLELELRPVDLINGEHLKEPYVKINPQHTVPTLDDDGKIIWDSHAIAAYLVDKYAKDDSLYPKDLYTRARVDQRLHFDSGVLFPRMRDCTIAIFREGYAVVPEERVKAVYEAYDLLESFLQNDLYLVGNSLTIADLCCIPTVSTCEYHAPIEAERYPKLAEWIERLSQLPYYEELHGKVISQFREFLDNRKEVNRANAS